MLLKNNKKGISIIEILVVISVVIIGLVGLLGMSTFSLKVSTLMRENNQANTIAQETIEAIRNFRDGTSWGVDGLGTLAANTDYYPKQFGLPPKWQLIQGTETIGIFQRKVVFNDVMRDTNDNIVESGGVIDSGTRKATVTISWKGKEVKITTYFTNWQ